MKKIWLLVLVGFLVFITACNDETKEDVDKEKIVDEQEQEEIEEPILWQELLDATANMELLDSYSMDVEVSIAGIVIESMFILVKGNYMEYPINTHASVKLFDIGGALYSLGNMSGLPTLEYYDGANFESGEFNDFSDFLDGEFLFEDGYYILTAKFIEDLKMDAKFKVVGDYVTEMIVEITVEGISVTSTVLFEDFNSVAIDIPFYITLEEIDMMYELSDNLDIYFGGSHDDYIKFYRTTGDLEIDCNPQTKNCLIEYTEDYMYNFGSKMITQVNGDLFYTVSEFLSMNNDDVFDSEFFVFIDYVTSLHTKTLASGWFNDWFIE